jgi:hypothetical protein
MSAHWSNVPPANGIAVKFVLTGAERFAVKEVEVFEIAGYIGLLADVKKRANGCEF